jgi:radical SAM superfamily enzyme YgiQ (UPF0313 family)
MAGALREAIPNLPVAIFDSPIERKGWKTFEAELRLLRPSYVGIGEEAVSCTEGLRAARLGKDLGAIVIAGGCFFANVAREVLATELVDIVVHGEGERTIVELIRALRSKDRTALRMVQGISFMEEGQLVFTGNREPITNLDLLPMPAFDLLPMHLYGGNSRNHPALVSLELSRGCPHECSFCVLWRQMGKFKISTPVSCFRTKSAERMIEEIQFVRRKFDRKYIGWVDPCFNADPALTRQVAEGLLSKGIKLGQSAWVRADHLRRDVGSGALDACIRAGLNELYIGVERRSGDELRSLNKGCVPTDAEVALAHISKHYPEVSTVGSFIYGIQGETRRSVRELIKSAYSLPLDIVFFIPLTPLPGTPFWRPELWDETGKEFREFNFLVGGALPTAEENVSAFRQFLTYWPKERILALGRGIVAKEERRRSIARRHFGRAFRFALRSAVRGPSRHGALMYTPFWYET